MPNRFLHIGINYLTPPNAETVARALDFYAPDWLRYSQNNWIVWTDKSAQQLTDFLRAYLPNDQYLVLPIDHTQNVQGWMSQMVWDWLNRPRDSGWIPPTPYVDPLDLYGAPQRRLGSPPGPPGPLGRLPKKP